MFAEEWAQRRDKRVKEVQAVKCHPTYIRSVQLVPPETRDEKAPTTPNPCDKNIPKKGFGAIFPRCSSDLSDYPIQRTFT